MDVEYRAAWVPFEEGGLEQPAALAVEWIEHECLEQGAGGLLVTPRAKVDGLTQPLQDFAARHGSTSARGGRPRRSGGDGPVLVAYPELSDLEFAGPRARGSSLCALEWPDLPLAGWATARDAVNLVTGEVPAPLDDGVAKLLERLVFAGNNGWFDASGKRDARRLLGELGVAAPWLDADFLAGYVLGKGQSADAAKHLHGIAAEIAA